MFKLFFLKVGVKYSFIILITKRKKKKEDDHLIIVIIECYCA